MPGYTPGAFRGGAPPSGGGGYRPGAFTGGFGMFGGGPDPMANPAMADLASRFGGGVDLMGLQRAQEAGSLEELMASGMNQEQALKAWSLRQNPNSSFAYNPKVNARSGDAYDPETYARSVSSTGPGGWGMVPMSSGVDYGFTGQRLGGHGTRFTATGSGDVDSPGPFEFERNALGREQADGPQMLDRIQHWMKNSRTAGAGKALLGGAASWFTGGAIGEGGIDSGIEQFRNPGPTWDSVQGLGAMHQLPLGQSMQDSVASRYLTQSPFGGGPVQMPPGWMPSYSPQMPGSPWPSQPSQGSM